MYKLSIITICYNEPDIEKTCSSIVNQSWQDFEWIVIDGGSNKKTLEVFEKYKHRINKFISEPDKGIYNAMNKGTELACGEYLNYMNGGDYFYDNDVLKDVINNNWLDTDIVFGNEYFIKSKNKGHLYISPDYITSEYLIKSSLRHQSSFFKSDLFKKYGLYDEKFKVVSDWERSICFFKNNCKFKHIPRTIASYNFNGVSALTNYKDEKQEVLKKYFTQKEIQNALSRNTFFENIFSIKNSYDKLHKIITLLGIQLKFRRNKAL